MYAIIMAGGSGTRFWPLSREKMPKQLLKIGGEDTLIRLTVARVLPLVRMEDIFIVANQSLADTISHQLSSKFPRSWDGNFILEPEAKNTAPALGLAALHLSQVDPESIMVVLAADHFIRKSADFLDLLRTAAKAAEGGYLVTLGIKPDRPETGYGYIKAGDACSEPDLSSIYKVQAFVEKPQRETAREYLKDGRYYWNSGIFVWKTGTLLSEIEKHIPPLHAGLMEIRKHIGTDREAEVVKEVFKSLDPISIDYAVMEKTDRAAVIPADIGWSDVGSWTALDDVSERNQAGNVVAGNVIDIGSSNSIVYAEKRLVATIGLNNMVVVDTPDATLVCSKDRAQDVKKIVDELKKRKAEEHLIHRTVYRPWGSYTVLEEGDRYKIKRIEVNPGAKLSHQMHHHRSEHWVVVAGTARVTNGDREYDVHPNESTYIPISTKHRLENLGKIPLQIIEVQNGEYLGEDDIVRFDDDYNRHATNTRRPLPQVNKEVV
ncbi:MAG: mannose-1-phosphate guanylyltransferase/mannose-6-phosphate isomerase [Nitrospirae bacterium GWD2_57_9]|nr:MAG: mannose-1-phosphate guanylyltransferase/mannose-6-phosphate isomerase [Nitrospirae bacterium GWD2_57_9]OGW47286.1 MAG: mannose-1-phosphate guanylyltransferase/mannose-6-phosphate isomerase [Nitrospirae bacterium GWC2_57_9]